MFLIFIHWIRGPWIKIKVINSYANCLIWVTGWIIFISSLIEGFLGHILNRGQTSYRGITAIINILSVLPFSGSIIAELIWRSSSIIINRIFILRFLVITILHFPIPIIINIHGFERIDWYIDWMDDLT